jgi:hypothetical protein
MFTFRHDPSIAPAPPAVPAGAPEFAFSIRSRTQVEAWPSNSAASALTNRSPILLEIDGPEYAQFATLLRTSGAWIVDQNGNAFPGADFTAEVDEFLSNF